MIAVLIYKRTHFIFPVPVYTHCFYLLLTNSFNAAAEAFYYDGSKFTAPIIVFIPDVCKRIMVVFLAYYASIPFFFILTYKKEGITLAKLRKFMRDRVHGTAVFLFKLFHFSFNFGFLIYPKAAELLEKAYFVFVLKAFDIRLIDIHLLHNLDCFYKTHPSKILTLFDVLIFDGWVFFDS